MLQEYGKSRDLIAAANAIACKPNHVALRLLELTPRKKLSRLSAAEVQQISAKTTEMRSTGLKRSSSALDNHEGTTLCAICMNNKKDMALIPCGHTFCQQCVHRAHMKTCAICRQPVASTLRLHS